MIQQKHETETSEERLIARFREHNLIPREVRNEVAELEAQGRDRDALRLILDAKED